MENQNPSPIRTFNPLRRVEAETMAWSEGIKTYSHDNGISIVATKNGAFIQVANVDFGSKGLRLSELWLAEKNQRIFR